MTEHAVGTNSEPTFSPVYVGLTHNLSKIFESHEKIACPQMCHANTTAVLADPDAGRIRL